MKCSFFILLLLANSAFSQKLRNLSLYQPDSNVLIAWTYNYLEVAGAKGNWTIRLDAGDIEQQSGTLFLVHPSGPGTVRLSLIRNGKLLRTIPYQVVEAGAFTAQLGGIRDSIVTVSQLVSASGLQVVTQNPIFKHLVVVLSFELEIGSGGEMLSFKPNIGNLLSNEQHTVLRRLSSGDGLRFFNIHAVGPNGRVQKLPDLRLYVR